MTQVLPPRSRVFHIGPQKTGTTALQMAAAARRSQLLDHGVYYPGASTTVGHRYEVAALVGKAVGWKTPDSMPPPRQLWDQLVDEVRARPERVLISHEYAAGATTQTVIEVAETFGADLQVLITLRSLSALLPSVWQETNKGAGNRSTFDRWLRQVLDEGSDVHQIIRRRHDQGTLIRRWSDVVGPDRVTVIVLNPDDHSFLFHSVEQLLGLPPELLNGANDAAAHAANRTLTVPEVELFRRFNKAFRAADTSWSDYDRLGLHGSIPRVLGHRTPPSDEPRLTMPDWAADRADQWSEQNAAAVAGSGVRVIGDVAWLALPAKRRRGPEEDHRRVTEVPIDLAVEAMLGISAAAMGREPDFRVANDPSRQFNRFTARELGAELYRRGIKRLRR